MSVQLETAARATDATHLELETPLIAIAKGQRMKLLITFEPTAAPAEQTQDFRSAIGSYYDDFPASQRMNTTEYMQALREDEAD